MNKPKQTDFPWEIPQTKPDRPLSKAMARMYDEYQTPRPEDNSLFSSFKYTQLQGFDYRDGDGTVSRRDPSKIIRVNGLYYVWYTKRDTQTPPQGPERCSDTIPSTDWDLAEIWYATSQDGFSWQEQGCAIKRPAKPQLGWRSVSTPDILVWQGKYYLYYQAFMQASGIKGDHCPVTLSSADSPDGPWTPCNKIVVQNGPAGSWDQFSIHDPYLLVYQGKIHLYYKAAFGDRPEYLVANGLAIADNPMGPFNKHPLNPVLNSGHETTYFPFKQGIAALAIRNGNENNTIQFAPDGVNFSIASVTSLMPVAAGPYVADAFNNTESGQGIEWGLSHFCDKTDPSTKHSFLGRFDCNLIQNANNTDMKETDVIHHPSVYFAQGLSEKQKIQRQQAAQEGKQKSEQKSEQKSKNAC
ncbi:glycoside hydrolase family 117 protein [Catenovulum maritimum]|uniref:Glycoside hydrolase n=1 Tax=Catenovulum maritimum TaxID=1513271 RepID=A0A0J8H1P7_9ALTE|nr:family 43 glycosylhydrolase [Catenovulum maritimum]AYW35312.1 neoagarobiose hydrolase 2 [Catenovulum maritimum]KMT66953.1 glycoside hydrolase [Catenovulum maritimum]